MQVLSVNAGRPVPIDNRIGRTGIYKIPVDGAVAIGESGLAGDAVCDTAHHGGPDQAVYLYGQPDYDFWNAELGRELEPGTFGENLTVAGLESARILIGDRFEVGEVLLEATSPRIPCSTFAARMGDPTWVKRFQQALRPGVYARVLRTGSVRAGDAVRHVPFEGEPISINELMADYRNPAPERMRRLLEAPLHRDLRAEYERALQALQQPGSEHREEP